MKPLAQSSETRRLELVAHGSQRAATGGPSARTPTAPDDEVANLDATRLRALVESVQAGVLVEDPSCRIILANQAFCDLFEIAEDPGVLLGWETRMVLDAIRERFVQPADVLEHTEALIEARQPEYSEVIQLTRGSTVERDYLPIFLDGSYEGHFWIFRDVTAHVEARRSLRRSGDRLRELSKITTGLGKGEDEDLVHALARVAELLGLHLGMIARIEGDTFIVEHVHPPNGAIRQGHRGRLDTLSLLGQLDKTTPVVAAESLSREAGPVDPLVEGAVVPEAVIAARMSMETGEKGLVALAGTEPRTSPWTETDRDLIHLFALWVGKTLERRRADEILRESERRYRDFVENSAALICIHDLEGQVIEANQAVLATLGLARPEQIVGHNLADFIEETHRDSLARYLETIAREGHSRGTMTVVAADGRHRVLAFDNSLRRQGVDQPVVRGLGQDITEQHRVQQILEQRMELEKLLLSLSTNFINLPVSAIEGMIDRTLAELGRYVDADLCLVFLLDEEREHLLRRYGWRRQESVPQEVPDRISSTDLFDLVQSIGRLEPYHVARPEDLPESAVAERAHFARFGMRSLLALPVSSRGEVLGFLGLAGITREIEWREEVISVFRVVGDILGGALDRKASAEALEEANQRLKQSNRELSWTNDRMSLLNEMGDLLQSSTDLAEAYTVIRDMAPHLCPGDGGAVYASAPERAGLDLVVSWGTAQDARKHLQPEDCWAFRRGRPYRVAPRGAEPLCRHATDSSGGSLCLPLLAQGETLGLLALSGIEPEGPQGCSNGADQLVLAVAEHMALGLANLRLRETLRNQALRDPLTGLFNRRYLEERLEWELHRAAQQKSPLAVLMIDIDHFKRINDTFGHEGGDLALSALADLLASGVRADDVVARFGGEEFTILLPRTAREDAIRIAEELRMSVHDLPVSSPRGPIDSLSVSIGVAAYPECDTSWRGLLRSADHALYRAKDAGRDQVIAADGASDPVVTRLRSS